MLSIHAPPCLGAGPTGCCAAQSPPRWRSRTAAAGCPPRPPARCGSGWRMAPAGGGGISGAAAQRSARPERAGGCIWPGAAGPSETAVQCLTSARTQQSLPANLGLPECAQSGARPKGCGTAHTAHGGTTQQGCGECAAAQAAAAPAGGRQPSRLPARRPRSSLPGAAQPSAPLLTCSRIHSSVEKG